MRFRNRQHAAELLAEKLKTYANDPSTIVLALPRGGVPIGFVAADALRAELDIVIVRKLGMPGYKELAMGAIGSNGTRILSERIISTYEISSAEIDSVTAEETRELKRREKVYRGDRAAPQLKDRTVILVDDGLATGATMLAAVETVRSQNPARIIVAVPVAARDACARLGPKIDDLVCLYVPQSFNAVGEWYDDFNQTDDQEVIELLDKAWHTDTVMRPNTFLHAFGHRSRRHTH